MLQEDLPFRETRFLGHREFNSDLFLFALLGVLCGVRLSFAYWVTAMVVRYGLLSFVCVSINAG